MSGINWNLADPAAAGNAAWQGFERGVQMGERARRQREEQELRGALADFSANPDDPAALRAVMERAPQLGMKLAEYSDQRAFRGALSAYVGENALLSAGRPALGAASGPGPAPTGALGNSQGMSSAPGQPPNSAPNAMLQLGTPPPAAPGASFGEAFYPYASRNALAPTPTDAAGVPVSSPQQGPTAARGGDPAAQPQAGLSFLGRPQSREDAAFLQMVRRDPIQALKIQSAMRDSFVERLDLEREYYAAAVEELSRVTDDAGWQSALQRVLPMAEAVGVNLDSVPRTYPGPEVVADLLQRSLGAKDQADLLMREANMEADNLRADRNTDSLIETREQQVERQRAFDEGRLDNQRRGQDLTDRRQRDRPPPRSNRRTPARSAGANDDLPLVRTPAEARRLPKGTRFRTPDGAVKRVP